MLTKLKARQTVGWIAGVCEDSGYKEYDPGIHPLTGWCACRKEDRKNSLSYIGYENRYIDDQ